MTEEDERACPVRGRSCEVLPHTVPGLGQLRALSAAWTVCGISQDDDLVCWGSVRGPRAMATTLVAHDVREVDVGWDRACFLETDGEVRCFDEAEFVAWSASAPEHDRPPLGRIVMRVTESGVESPAEQPPSE